MAELSKMYADAQSFNDRFGFAHYGPPRALTNGLAKMRRDIIAEELDEYTVHQRAAEAEASSDVFDHANYTHHLSECLDGLVDVVYAALVTASLHGFDFDEAWDRVHRANMMKVRGPKKDADANGRGGTYDIVKPEGWERPNLDDLVENNDRC